MSERSRKTAQSSKKSVKIVGLIPGFVFGDDKLRPRADTSPQDPPPKMIPHIHSAAPLFRIAWKIRNICPAVPLRCHFPRCQPVNQVIKILCFSAGDGSSQCKLFLRCLDQAVHCISLGTVSVLTHMALIKNSDVKYPFMYFLIYEAGEYFLTPSLSETDIGSVSFSA